MTDACLKDLRVLDLTRVLAGPFCTALLGDLGAEVLKVETLEGDDYRHVPPIADGTGALFRLLNRGKQSLALDLRSDRGRAILGPAAVPFRSSESDALPNGGWLWQRHTGKNSSGMRFGSHSRVV